MIITSIIIIIIIIIIMLLLLFDGADLIQSVSWFDKYILIIV